MSAPAAFLKALRLPFSTFTVVSNKSDEASPAFLKKTFSLKRLAFKVLDPALRTRIFKLLSPSLGYCLEVKEKKIRIMQILTTDARKRINFRARINKWNICVTELQEPLLSLRKFPSDCQGHAL